MGRIWTPSEKRTWGTILLLWGLVWLRTFSPGRGAILMAAGVLLWLSAIKEERAER
ncbi:MAG: hypothetical protein PHF14_05890 [Verrucomicrobiota bacterium]|jgi:hypothetical protein|nr:hypothetical protein [Verrucomicrobiota bacterium]MDD8045973.1 hypothetical protein [Verrucomicrobiota bacterium]MDD8050846.1 hypothetical protein [Verrucomicrobiota bacterium]MDI9384039.1 hypothetical protein [Verrucomicrobiota bacterium]